MIQRVHLIFATHILVGFVALIFLLSVIIFLCGISSETNQPLQNPLTAEHITQARKILYEGTKTKPNDIAAISLTESDLNLAGNYLVNRYHRSAIHVELVNQKLRCALSIALPKNSIANYFNVSFRLGSEEGELLPHIAKFKVGKLLLPTKFADFMIHILIRYSFLNDYFILATTPIQSVEIKEKTLTIFYESDSNNHIINPQSREIYQQKILEITAQHNKKWRLSLADLLKPVFELANQRATFETAIEENRSAILALNDYVNAEKNSAQEAVFLFKRKDLAQHFIGAAALAASMNSRVANALGEVKELSDAQAGGSGFSFIDLAADKAGSRFGALAVSTPENARRFQQYIAQIKDYYDFMPDPRDLPEHMSEAEFKRRFESTQSSAYATLAAKIDKRISHIPLYQSP
jgi:hypothetical protein